MRFPALASHAETAVFNCRWRRSHSKGSASSPTRGQYLHRNQQQSLCEESVATEHILEQWPPSFWERPAVGSKVARQHFARTSQTDSGERWRSDAGTVGAPVYPLEVPEDLTLDAYMTWEETDTALFEETRVGVLR